MLIPRHRPRRGIHPRYDVCVICLGEEGGPSWYRYHIPRWKFWEREDAAAVEAYLFARALHSLRRTPRVDPES